jgi:CarD family transcriptional regulator
MELPLMTTATATPTAFRPGDHIVYPAHGVGRVMGVEKQSVAGIDLDVFVISFEQDKMTLRVPTTKARASGMRPLASSEVVDQAMKTLQGRARIKRTMWSRRAQEYEAKINSGDLVSIAEVVRDLHRASDQPEQSYSERQLYESALDRMARELAAVQKVSRDDAIASLSASLASKKQAAAAA